MRVWFFLLPMSAFLPRRIRWEGDLVRLPHLDRVAEDAHCFVVEEYWGALDG